MLPWLSNLPWRLRHLEQETWVAVGFWCIEARTGMSLASIFAKKLRQMPRKRCFWMNKGRSFRRQAKLAVLHPEFRAV